MVARTISANPEGCVNDKWFKVASSELKVKTTRAPGSHLN
jgi:hypothetical protein